MKLQKTVKYTGKMELKTGLAIKGSSNTLNIGGIDSEVVKNPITEMPYIPGSSLKGKLRSLCERTYGASEWVEEDNINKRDVIEKRTYGKKQYKVKSTKNPCGCGSKACMICKIFGAHMNPGASSAPTRMIVRDCNLSRESLEIINSMPLESGSYMENKAENIIDRQSGTVGSPRFMERIPAGLSFDVEIVLQIFEGDSEEDMKSYINDALRMLEDSYLGGSGSRGYGQVKFDGVWS